MLACHGCLVSSAAAAAVPCSTSARWSGVSCISSRLAGATGADLGGGGLCGTAARIGVGVSNGRTSVVAPRVLQLTIRLHLNQSIAIRYFLGY